MADVNFPGLFAGSFDPSKVAKFGWNAPKDMPSFGSFSLAGPSDPYAALRAKYPRKQLDVSKLDKESQGIGAIMEVLREDPVLLAELEEIRAQKANEMSRKNLKLAEEAAMREQERAEQRAIRQQGREFTYDQLTNLFSSIPRAFNPIPFDRTQEVVANIANITNPRNIKAIPTLQQAQFSMPNKQYFG